jgi:putative pyruvate formate lyase activating enzyme
MTSATRFTVPHATPAYLTPEVRQTLAQRVAQAREELAGCRACPRSCAVNRAAGEKGYCGVGRRARVASAFPHFGEEDCLRGTRGSGTIFFSGCNLHCVFCQNWDISQRPSGQEMDARQIAGLMLSLQEDGCHNINLVTPEHVVPHVIEALALAIDGGLRLPVVYNTSAYDALASLKLLDGLIDVYMPDFKFWTEATAARLADAGDYPDRAREAIREMHRQVGDLRFTPDGVAARGLLIRHLVLPGLLAESRQILQWLARELSPDTYVNIMAQYHPANEVGVVDARAAAPGAVRHADINRRPTRAELTAAYEAARAAGLWRFDQRHS